MSEPTRTPDRSARILQIFIALALAWTLLVMGSLYLDFEAEDRHAVKIATMQAKASIDKDISFRAWATSHGGVYVPVDELTPPNPYLAHIPERDLTTPSGRRLTLMNPAYMIRQLSEGFAVLGERTHITSLKPLNPMNAADPWETEALKRFEKGAKQRVEVTQVDGEETIRMMTPFKVEKGCLKCHAHQGYKIGDIRGGISVSLPMQPFRRSEAAEIDPLILGHGVIWTLGTVFLMTAGTLLSRAWKRREEIRSQLREAHDRLDLQNRELEVEVERRTSDLLRTNRELEDFSNSVSLNLREPLRGITGFSEMLLEEPSLKSDASAARTIERIIEASRGMDAQLDAIVSFHDLSEAPVDPIDIDLSAMALKVFEEVASAHELPPGVPLPRFEALPTPQVNMDPLLARKLLGYLIDNAFKFSLGRTEAARIELYSFEKEGSTWYAIKDNGVGFDSNYADRLFKLFGRLHTEAEFPGRGAGLAMSQRIVSKHHGRIEIDSRKDLGTEVRFTFDA